MQIRCEDKHIAFDPWCILSILIFLIWVRWCEQTSKNFGIWTWRAMHMVVVGCDCGSNCTCNAWGASATNYDAANDQKQQLDDGEITGARTLGARVVEIAALLAAGKEKQKGLQRP